MFFFFSAGVQIKDQKGYAKRFAINSPPTPSKNTNSPIRAGFRANPHLKKTLQRASFFAQKRAFLSEKCLFLTERDTSPNKRGAFLIEREASPDKRDAFLIERDASPDKSEAFPTERDVILIVRSAFLNEKHAKDTERSATPVVLCAYHNVRHATPNVLGRQRPQSERVCSKRNSQKRRYTKTLSTTAKPIDLYSI
jgi:hypothetical protein